MEVPRRRRTIPAIGDFRWPARLAVTSITCVCSPPCDTRRSRTLTCSTCAGDRPPVIGECRWLHSGGDARHSCDVHPNVTRRAPASLVPSLGSD